jgi:aspartyl-tRNA(Asn)/glutamyl-tRNA(Gln) amidotransferase subunit C
MQNVVFTSNEKRVIIISGRGVDIPMSLTVDQVEHVARLARLEISPEEKERFTHQLNDILQYVEKLQQLDTEGIEPTAHVIPLQNVFRDDKTCPSFDKEDILANAPDREEDFFRVPQIMEESN